MNRNETLIKIFRSKITFNNLLWLIFKKFYYQAKKFVPPPKITRAQIQEQVVEQQKEKEPPQPKKVPVGVEDEDLAEPIPENVNRLLDEGETATTIDEALNVLK